MKEQVCVYVCGCMCVCVCVHGSTHVCVNVKEKKGGRYEEGIALIWNFVKDSAYDAGSTEFIVAVDVFFKV